jgi:DNA processing protein
MDRLEALIGLNMIPGIGSVKLAKLLEVFSSPEDIFKAPFDKLKHDACLKDEIAGQINSFDQENLSRELGLIKKHKLDVLTVCDNDYPQNLKNIPAAPIVLYLKGELKQEDKLAIGIVGSRRASVYGLNNASRFAGRLSEQGFTIISGMALGVDTYAHRGALKAGGRTIAVMGSGFGHIYPRENRSLAEEIAENGAVISEFPIEMRPLAQNFPRRNRIISGLSLGILVVQAAKNSGALITADFALEQGREVFALPGEIDTENSSGSNELIKQGAKLVSCADEIAEEFILPVAAANLKREEASGESFTPKLSNEKESRLYALLCAGAMPIDELASRAGLDIPQISAILLKLELKKLVRELPGKQFIRN